MLTTLKSLRRGCLLLAVLILLCLMPGSARANAPAPDPYRKTIILSDTDEVTAIAVYVDGPDGSFYLLKTFESEHKKQQKIQFERPRSATRFYIQVTMTDGTVRASEPVDGTERNQKFLYHVKDNTLKKTMGNTLGWLYLPLVLLGMVLALALPLGFTVLVEFLTAIPFQLKPYKYVILINVVTNLAMNVLLFILSLKGTGVWIVALLEVTVVLVEYLFYVKKYKDYPKRKLLLFSIIANALSWGLYELALSFLF